MGLSFALIFAGAGAWANALGLQMSWWKWALAALWYCLLSVGVGSGFTLIGEKECRAGWRLLAACLIVMSVLGVALWSIL